MKFGMTPAPFLKTKRSTKQIMIEFFIAISIVWIASIIFNFTIGSDYGIKAILMGVVSLLATLLTDVVVAIVIYKTPLPENASFKEVSKNLTAHCLKYTKNSFSSITALLFALTLPIGTPYFVIVIGAVFATFICKVVFGGFGHNIFNPAIMARIVVGVSYGGLLTHYLDPKHIEIGGILSSATPTTSYAKDWFSLTFPEGIKDFGQLFLGNYSGALGETFTALILIIGVILVLRKVIDWKIPTFFIGTVLLCSVATALTKGVNPLGFSMLQLSLGGLVFGGVFMMTDPVTSPTSSYGKIIFAIGAGFLTFIIRLYGNFPEGTMFAIAIMTCFVPLIDKSIAGLTTKKVARKWGFVSGLLAVVIAINIFIVSIPVSGGSNDCGTVDDIACVPTAVTPIAEKATFGTNSTFSVVVKVEGKADLTLQAEVNFTAKKVSKVTASGGDSEGANLLNGSTTIQKELDFYNKFIKITTPITFEEIKNAPYKVSDLNLDKAGVAASSVMTGLRKIIDSASTSLLSTSDTVVNVSGNEYTVSVKNTWGTIHAKVTLDKASKKVTKVEILTTTTQNDGSGEVTTGDEYGPLLIKDILSSNPTTEFAKTYTGNVNLSFDLINNMPFYSDSQGSSGPNFGGASGAEATYTGKTIVLAIKAAVETAMNV